MSTIVDGEKRIPFLRGMLTHYLIEHEFTFDEAYRVADRVRSDLQKEDDVPRSEFLERVQDAVHDLYGERTIGDGVFWEPGERQVLVEEDEGGYRPFSRSRLSLSLAISGLDDQRAYRIAEQVLADFVQRRKGVVSRKQIRKQAMRLLEEHAGKAVSQRYDVWHQFRNSDSSQPLIVLIGGATGVGKTSVAVALANLMNISRMSSTDEIRQVMRLSISQELMPTLHTSSYLAWEALSHSPGGGVDPVLYAFQDQASRVCVGVRATIERALEENVSLIVDGTHLLPDLLDLGPYEEKAVLIFVNLFLSGKGRQHKERFKRRGLQASERPKHRYVAYLDQILRIQKHILAVGETYSVPAIENVDFDETVQTLSLQIVDTLRRREVAK